MGNHDPLVNSVLQLYYMEVGLKACGAIVVHQSTVYYMEVELKAYWVKGRA